MLFIHSVKINKSYILFAFIVIIILITLIIASILYPISLPANSSSLIWENTINETTSEKKNYIKWVDFSATYMEEILKNLIKMI